MSYKIIPTETFKTQVRTLQKKYPHIRQDLKDLSKRLKHNPKSGKALGRNDNLKLTTCANPNLTTLSFS
ncbi:MAG: hypothetical protein LWW97_11805 [Deltaproteobacteria bacterium]|nr:hypothetical protein [Deltaproteobacteria bacterium]